MVCTRVSAQGREGHGVHEVRITVPCGDEGVTEVTAFALCGSPNPGNVLDHNTFISLFRPLDLERFRIAD